MAIAKLFALHANVKRIIITPNKIFRLLLSKEPKKTEEKRHFQYESGFLVNQ